MKTHFAILNSANESDNLDDWSDTYCGLTYTESKLTNKKEFVTCKKCLRAMKKKLKIKWDCWACKDTKKIAYFNEDGLIKGNYKCPDCNCGAVPYNAISGL